MTAFVAVLSAPPLASLPAAAPSGARLQARGSTAESSWRASASLQHTSLGATSLAAGGCVALGCASLAQRRSRRAVRCAPRVLRHVVQDEQQFPPSRRSAGLAAAAALLPQLLLPASASAERLATLTEVDLAEAKGKVVVITGATSGVGLEAARTLVRAGSDVYVTGRTLAKAEAAVANITAGAGAGAGRAIPLELNLASLSSVRSFAKKWSSDVKRPIDVLACNAGLALGQDQKEPSYTEDGFELTVGTNHLGHFLLANLMRPQLSPTARIVVTASSVHDPSTGDPGSQAGLGNLSGLEVGHFGKGASAMVDGGSWDAGKAYKDSKLANVEFTLELARRLKQEGSKITVNCLSPGLIPSPTFFRNQSPAFAGTFAWAANNLLHISETTEFGGDTLVFMALDKGLEGRSGVFFSAVPPGQHVFMEKIPSPEARDETEAAELWRRSAALVGL